MISIFPSEQMAPAKGPSERAAQAANPKDKSESSPFASMMAKDDPANPKQAETTTSTPGAVEDTKLPGDLAPMVLDAEAPGPQTDLLGVTPQTSETQSQTKLELAIASAEADLETKPKLATANETGVTKADANLKLNQAIGPEAAIAPDAEIDPEVQVKTKPDLARAPEATKDVLAKATTADAEVKAQVELPSRTAVDGEEPLRIQRNVDPVEAARAEIRDPGSRHSADTNTGAEKLLLGAEKITPLNVSRDAPIATAEPLLSVAQSQQASSSQVVSNGLTPTAPAVQVASPNEITSIILNNLKNGADPKEQMIIQLDPPELGRVSIDFKFDAQGVQQITVTAETPEALKRLRELHFELTEALRENGLSDKNMSFRQESGEQQQPNWQMSELSGPMSASATVQDVQPAPVLTRQAANSMASERLDLTL